jgi:hypothetical protein
VEASRTVLSVEPVVHWRSGSSETSEERYLTRAHLVKATIRTDMSHEKIHHSLKRVSKGLTVA